MDDQPDRAEVPELPSDELLAMAIGDAPLGIGVANSQLYLTYANRRWRELSGFDGPLPADPGVMLDLVHPDDRDRVAEAFIAAHLSSGQVRERIRALADGDDDSVRHLSLTLRPIGDDPANGYVLGLSDITELIAALNDARRSEERFRTVTSSLPIGVYRADPRGRLIWTNRRLVEFGSYQGAEERGSSIYDFIHPDDVDDVADKAKEAFRQRAPFEAQHRFLARDGSVRWVISRASPIIDDHGRIIEHIGSLEDVTELHLKNLGLAHRAAHDPLTALPNRAAIIDLVTQLAEQSPGRNDVGVVFLDLDGFKAVNDRFGHQAGDAVLVEVSDRLRRVIRQVDTVGRYGGDEFVIVCPGISQPEVLEGVAQRATEIIESSPVTDGVRDHDVGASVGTGLGPGSGSVDDLLRRADEAMYEAKRRKQ